MTPSLFSIQELSEKSGFPRRTIHFYIQQGILPPASGAGLAAGYDEIHLLRLRLVPLLRQQGLRLDEIRDRLNQTPPTELPTLIDHLSRSQPAPITPPKPPSNKVKPRTYLHYPLPAGLELTAPADLSPADFARLHQLIEAAHHLFNPEA